MIYNSRFLVAVVILLATVAVASSARANPFSYRRNEARLLCYSDLRGHVLSAATRSTYSSLKQSPEGAADYIHKIFRNPSDQYAVVPSKRAGKNGFYIFSDMSSGYLELPPEKPTSGTEKPATDCYQFSDDRELDGTIFINYGNYADWTNPAEILSKAPDGKTCKLIPFHTLIDPESDRSLQQDLAQQIADISRVAPKLNAQERQSTLKALDACRGRLQMPKDKIILDSIQSTYHSLEGGGKGRVNGPAAGSAI